MSAVMQSLTEMSVILLPLTLVTGIFGMNLDIPFQTGYDNRSHISNTGPFWGLMVFFILFAWISARYMKKKGFY